MAKPVPAFEFDDLKLCKKCGIEKERTEFYKDKRNLDGLYYYCKSCHKSLVNRYQGSPENLKYKRNWHLQKNYGLFLEDLETLGDCCAICGSKDDLCVDHCHTTGVVRGRLCRTCNLGLGYFKDNPETCVRASYYLLALKDEGSA